MGSGCELGLKKPSATVKALGLPMPNGLALESVLLCALE
jgi:hypothetical protein